MPKRNTKPRSSGSSSLRLRAVWPVIRAAGLVPLTISFIILFLVTSSLVAVFEPDIGGFRNAVWLMFQVVTTIGLGDFTCYSLVGRVAAIVLSIYSVFFVALITGTVVSYCQENMRARRDESVAQFIDQLEHLPELSPEELAELSQRVRALDTRTR